VKAFLSLLAGRKGNPHALRASHAKKSTTMLVFVLGLFLVLAFPSWRTIYRYSASFKFAAALLYSLAFCALFAVVLIFKDKIAGMPILGSPLVSIVPLILIFLVAAFIYPKADSLKYVMRGSDQDDAVIVCTQALLNGNSPYSVRTYYGNPPSPGPGELLLYLPFVHLGLYPFGTLIILFLAALLLRRSCSSWLAPNMFLLALSSSLAFWELVGVGSDLHFVGAIMLISALLVSNERSKGWFVFCIGSVLCGFAATARIVFLFVPLVFGFVLLRRSKAKALAFFLISLFTALSLHVFFNWITPGIYTPMHLLETAVEIFDDRIIMGLSILACLCVAWIVFHDFTKRNIELTGALAVTLGAPLFLTALTGLITRRHGDLASWEGANVLAPAAVLAGAAFAVHICKSTGSTSQFKAETSSNSQGIDEGSGIPGEGGVA
jgi:hypothetical protein